MESPRLNFMEIELRWGRELPDSTDNPKFRSFPLVSGRVQKILFANTLPKVLIVGEGREYTFTAAFVALRQSFENVVTSSLGIPEPSWAEAVRSAMSHAQSNQSRLASSWDENKVNVLYDNSCFTIEEVYARYGKAFGHSPSTGPAFFRDVDATKLENDDRIHDHCENIFFQCPFAKDRTGALVRNVIESAGRVQNAGNYLLIGITKNGKYSHNYNLGTLIDKSAPEIGYQFEGIDDLTIQKFLHLGYKHMAISSDIHKDILSDHVTLVFRKLVDANTVDEDADNLNEEFAKIHVNSKEITTPKKTGGLGSGNSP